MKQKLLPCPFCGSVNTRIEPTGAQTDSYVCCWGCTAEGPVEDTPKQSVKAWNTRIKLGKSQRGI